MTRKTAVMKIDMPRLYAFMDGLFDFSVHPAICDMQRSGEVM